MTKLLTQSELKMHFFNFKEILGHFDYTPIKNIRFFNMESLYNYMENVEGNPFQRQYKALSKELDYLQPYLPFTSSNRAAEFMTAIAKTTSEEENIAVKKEFTQKLRMDFIQVARTTTTEEGWKALLQACENIRLHKEETSLALF